MKALSLLNWIVLSLAVLATILGAAVALLMWPFPRVAGSHGVSIGTLLMATGIAVVVAVFAALSTWLLEKRHRLMWAGQSLLLMVLIIGLVVGLMLRNLS